MMTLSNASALNDLRSYSRHWLGEFIELYQAEQCLWQPKHPDYSNHSVRNKAYEKLVEKLKEVEPHPDRAMVVRKINSLRSAFRREYRKKSMKANYETRLWYYNNMLFIADQHPKRLVGSDNKIPKRSLALSFDDDDSMEFDVEEHQADASGSQTADGSQHDEQETVTLTTNNCLTLVKSEEITSCGTQHQQEQQQQQHQHLQHHHQLQHQTHGATQPQHTTAVKVLEITSLDSNSQREIQQAVNSLEHQHQMQQQLQQHASAQQASDQLAHIHQHVPTIQIAREHLQPLFNNSTSYATTTGATHRQDDEYDAIGVNVASKLRVMNPTQRIIAEKLISDVLFNGQLDNLSVSSSLAQ